MKKEREGDVVEKQESSEGGIGPRWATIYESMTGATAPGTHVHSEDIVGANADSVKAGHETDVFDVKGIIMVPVVITITVGLTLAIITGLFSYYKPGVVPTDKGSPLAVKDNAADYNDRIGRISSTDENAPVKQPRLEWMRRLEVKPGEPVSYRSFGYADSGNPPEITPIYLRAENFIDWNTNERKLLDAKWVSKEKGVARIPIAQAMEILAHDKPLAVAKAGTAAPTGTVESPKLSNGGQAAKAPKLAEKPKDDHKGHKH